MALSKESFLTFGESLSQTRPIQGEFENRAKDGLVKRKRNPSLDDQCKRIEKHIYSRY